MRKRLYEIIEAASSAEQFDLASLIYDVIIISAVLLSIFPLALKQEPKGTSPPSCATPSPSWPSWTC